MELMELVPKNFVRGRQAKDDPFRHVKSRTGSQTGLAKRMFKFTGLLAILALMWPSPARAQEKQTMPDMPDMDMSSPQGNGAAPEETPQQKAAELQSTKESEFNHHLAGLLVFIAGLAILLQDQIRPYWAGIRYVLSVCFLLGGIYLLVFSDTEIWPWGPQTFWYAITHNPEDLQHKTFSVILLFIGTIEYLRASGRLKAWWSGWVFPVVGVAGAIMLLFHKHSPGMHGAHHMSVMMHVKSEHLGFAITGFGIALSKGLSEPMSSWRPFLNKVWPALLMVLGVLLMLYSE